MSKFSHIRGFIGRTVSGLRQKIRGLKKPAPEVAEAFNALEPEDVLKEGAEKTEESMNISINDVEQKDTLESNPTPNDPRPTPLSPEESVFEPITRKNFYKHPIFWARFLGYAIPLSFLLYVLYLNYLPFGYHKTFTINVGSPNDTKVSEFYLEPSPNLSGQKIDSKGIDYRELNGIASLVFKPNAVLKDADITVETKDIGVNLIPPYINFDANSIKWNYDWNFSQGIPEELTNAGTFFFEEGTYFDGKSRAEAATSSNSFEDGRFAVYAEWNPESQDNDFQEIVGHFNWELLQERNRVRFVVGRMDDEKGKFYSIYYKIQNQDNFFYTKHSALAIYSPDPVNGLGYVELYVDNKFVDRQMIGKSVIWKDYNGNRNLTFGLSGHGTATHYQGAIYTVRISDKQIFDYSNKILFKFTDNEEGISIPIVTTATTTLYSIQLHVQQK